MSCRTDDARQEEPETRKSRVSKLALVVALVLGAMFVIVSWPVAKKQRVAADRTFAISSLKFINMELIQFDYDYGRFPDASTIASVRAATGTTIALGTSSSNDFFRQLVADGKTSEKLFWAPALKNRTKPNDILGGDALAKGECIHSYIPGLSRRDDSSTPVVMALMIPYTRQFDPTPFGGKAVVLRVNGAARQEPLRTDTPEVIIGSKNLLDPGQPYWHGKAPDLKYPE